VTDPAQLFAQNLEAAFRVGQRLAQAQDHLRPVLPLSEDLPGDSLDDDNVVWIDAFWFEAGQLRNQLAHSYPLSNPKQIHRINGAFGRTGLLLATFNSVRTHAHDKGLARIPVGPLPETDLQP